MESPAPPAAPPVVATPMPWEAFFSLGPPIGGLTDHTVIHIRVRGTAGADGRSIRG